MIRIISKTGANNEDETWKQSNFLFFTTEQGTVKKTALEEFQNIRQGGIIAIGIEQGDKLIDVKLTSGHLFSQQKITAAVFLRRLHLLLLIPR